ncbi:zinc finger protein 622 [Galendromus occidentalis]|uniref:Zinc finger protein 622 n=1 Tax=Galendromus occidentalis TaxID=34638 RepID=A0AAJ7SGL7_9ACAR|nr:zinc finger protein 622 [Galendromus occidentalis]
MADSGSQLTCLTCKVLFATGELQRTHYRCDWHRYNLKRKVASLPPVSAEEFARRVQAQRAQDEQNNRQEPGHCKVCKKTFASQQALENHYQSKKHHDQLKKIASGEAHLRRGPLRIRPPVTETLEIKTRVSDESVGEDDWEDIDEDEVMEENPSDEGERVENRLEKDKLLMEPKLEDCIPIHVCLFCNRKSVDSEGNLEHMAKAHSFFIPDPDYLEDLEGLLKYLGYKVGALKVCLLCDSDQKTPFRTIHAVQQHMLDKGHTAMFFDSALEYSDFYDFSSTHPEGADADEEFNPELLQMNPDWSLQLPSGVFIGHRSLARYYRQNLPPERPGMARNRGALLFQNYKALGWTGASTKEQAMAKARDQKFAQKVLRQSYLKLGVKANKLQHHFRQQVMF